MANPLTVIIPMKQDADIAKLAGILHAQQDAIDAARSGIATLHYTFFLILDHSSPNLQLQPGSSGPFSLAVITIFDGELDDYIAAVVKDLGPAFSLLLSYSADGQHLLPVADHYDEFAAYIRGNDASQHPPNDQLRFWGAYPDTAQQIVGDTS